MYLSATVPCSLTLICMFLIAYALFKIRNKFFQNELDNDFKKSSHTLLVELNIFLIFTLPTIFSDVYVHILVAAEYGMIKLNLIYCIQSIFGVTNIFVLIFNETFRSCITARCAKYSISS